MTINTKQPQYWTKQEVGLWLNWCVQEYSIEPIPPDKLEMNVLTILFLEGSFAWSNQTLKLKGIYFPDDFISRLPKNGDLLYNSLQSLMQQNQGNDMCSSMSGYPALVSPVSCGYQPNHLESLQNNGLIVLSSQKSEPSTEVTQSKPTRPIPILPQPVSLTTTSHQFNGTYSQNHAHLRPPDSGKTINTVPGVLSPAPSGTDSATDDELAPETDDRDISCEEIALSHSLAGTFLPKGSILNPDCIRRDNGQECRLLWEYIHQLLEMPHKYNNFVCWENKDDFIFRIVNPTGLASLWGQQKNRSNMTYEKLSRALRYYYRMNIIKKVSGRRLTYQFLQPPANIQKGQRGAKPHSRVGPIPIAPAPMINKRNDCYGNPLNPNFQDTPTERPVSVGSIAMPKEKTIDLSRTAISLPTILHSPGNSSAHCSPKGDQMQLDLSVPITANSSVENALSDIKTEEDYYNGLRSPLLQNNCSTTESSEGSVCNSYDYQTQSSDLLGVENRGNILSIPSSPYVKQESVKMEFPQCFQTEPEDLSLHTAKRNQSSSPPGSIVYAGNKSANEHKSEELFTSTSKS